MDYFTNKYLIFYISKLTFLFYISLKSKYHSFYSCCFEYTEWLFKSSVNINIKLHQLKTYGTCIMNYEIMLKLLKINKYKFNS